MSLDDQSGSRTAALQRHLRLYLGMLMNSEEELHPALFNRQEAYQFAVAAHDALEPAASQAPPSSAGQLASQPRWTHATIASELIERMSTLLGLIQLHAPRHVLLRDFQAGLAQCRSCYASPSSHGMSNYPPHAGDSSSSETIAGVPFPRLLELYARCSSLPETHSYVPWFTLFLAGLNHGITMLGSQPGSDSDPLSESRCDTGIARPGWVAACQESLRAAVAFAFQADPQALVRRTVRLPEDRAFHCLFVGIAYVLNNPTPAAREWLDAGSPREKRAALFFGMGVLAAEADFARRLVLPIGAHLARLVAEHLSAQTVPLVTGVY